MDPIVGRKNGLQLTNIALEGPDAITSTHAGRNAKIEL